MHYTRRYKLSDAVSSLAKQICSLNWDTTVVADMQYIGAEHKLCILVNKGARVLLSVTHRFNEDKTLSSDYREIKLTRVKLLNIYNEHKQ